MVCDRETVLCDVAVFERGDALRQLRHQRIAIAPIEQIASPEHRQIDVDRLRAEQRVEVLRLLPTRHAQHAGNGPRIALGTATGVPVGDRTRRHSTERKQCRHCARGALQ